MSVLILKPLSIILIPVWQLPYSLYLHFLYKRNRKVRWLFYLAHGHWPEYLQEYL